MANAICIKCGAGKKRPFAKCAKCGFDPRGDDLALARSIRLSTRYTHNGMDGPPVTEVELEEIGDKIENSGSYEFDENEIRALLREKHLLDRGLSLRDKLRIAVFIGVLWLLGIGGAVLFLKRHSFF